MASLPILHRDPFDRMLVCQALAHGLVLATPDAMSARTTLSFADHSNRVIMVFGSIGSSAST